MEGYSNEHFWQVSYGNYIGSLQVQVSDSAKEIEVKKKVLGLFENLGFKSVVVQIDKNS